MLNTYPGKLTWIMLFTFTDLFAGIGGNRLALERIGGRCVFSSEIDKYACETYRENFGEKPSGDIMKINPSDIPHHNILSAGFPCQPFSRAGVSKRKSLNIPHGFECREKGQLFFNIVEILKVARPDTFLLENVKHLKTHNNGVTFQTVQSELEQVGYVVTSQIIDARCIVPQHRERLYIVGFRKDLDLDFKFPHFPYYRPIFKKILDHDVNKKYTLTDNLWSYLKKYKEKHRKKGNGFGYSLVDINGFSRTLSARYYKDGAEILIPQEDDNPRKLTPRECARLMGFPDSFKIPVSDTQAYRQFGNSVVVPIVEVIAWEIVVSLFRDQVLSPMKSLLEQSVNARKNSSNGAKNIIQGTHGEIQITISMR